MSRMRSSGTNQIRDLRGKRLWSQQELARRAGVSIVTVNRAEMGKQVPRVVTQEKIARALGHARTVVFPEELEEAAS